MSQSVTFFCDGEIELAEVRDSLLGGRGEVSCNESEGELQVYREDKNSHVVVIQVPSDRYRESYRRRGGWRPEMEHSTFFRIEFSCYECLNDVLERIVGARSGFVVLSTTGECLKRADYFSRLKVNPNWDWRYE